MVGNIRCPLSVHLAILRPKLGSATCGMPAVSSLTEWKFLKPATCMNTMITNATRFLITTMNTCNLNANSSESRYRTTARPSSVLRLWISEGLTQAESRF